MTKKYSKESEPKFEVKPATAFKPGDVIQFVGDNLVGKRFLNRSEVERAITLGYAQAIVVEPRGNSVLCSVLYNKLIATEEFEPSQFAVKIEIDEISFKLVP